MCVCVCVCVFRMLVLDLARGTLIRLIALCCVCVDDSTVMGCPAHTCALHMYVQLYVHVIV